MRVAPRTATAILMEQGGACVSLLSSSPLVYTGDRGYVVGPGSIASLIVLVSLLAGTTMPITRTVAPMTLGMLLEEFTRTVQSQEVSGAGLLPGEREFVVDRTHFPAKVREIRGRFYRHHLFRIQVTYTSAYAQRVSWPTFLQKAIERYGMPSRFPTTEGGMEAEIAMWDDGTTSLIAELVGPESKPVTYLIIYLDDALYAERRETCRFVPPQTVSTWRYMVRRST